MALNTDNVKKVKVGLLSGFTGQGSNAIAIGYNSGYTNQGDNSISIGTNSSAINSDNSIVIGTSASTKLDISNQLVIGFDASNNSYGGIYGANLGKNNFKLGINTNNPLYDLDVSGETKLKYIRDINDSLGISGQVLSSTTTGIQWVTGGGGGSSQWTTSGNNIYNNNSGYVGIGTTTPAYVLDVNGETRIQTTNVRYGLNSGLFGQGNAAIAIGYNSGLVNQGQYGIGIGYNAGYFEQGQYSVAMGIEAGYSDEKSGAVGIGFQAGSLNQGTNAISLGVNAGYLNQLSGAVGIGYRAGFTGQGINSVAVGSGAGNSNQGEGAVAIGYNSGYTNQGDNSIAIGTNSSAINSDNSIVIGTSASTKLDISNQLVIGFDASNNSYGGIYGANLGKNNFKLGINTNNPLYDLDVSGRTIIRDSLYMNSTDISDVSGIYFRDGTYIGHGSSFDIRSPEIIKLNNNSIVITNNNVGIGKEPTIFDLSANDIIYAIKYSNVDNSIYVGGNFTEIYINNINSPVNAICKVYLNNGTIDNMNGGVVNGAINGECYAIDIDSNNNVYIGGSFATADGIIVNNIAKWDGSSWSQLGQGVGGNCRAIAIDSSNNIYAGGSIMTAGEINVNRIAKWDGSSWSELSTGLDGVCHAIAIDSSNNVYVGGNFTTAGETNVNNIARWNGTIWEPLTYSLIFDFNNGVDGPCYAIAIDINNNVYVGGQFSSVSDGLANMNNIAVWKIASSLNPYWRSLDNGLDDTCLAITLDNNNVYVGGNFTTADGIIVNHIAKWISSGSGNSTNAGGSWSAIGTGLSGIFSFTTYCNTIAINNNDIYVGGDFTGAGDISSNNFAYWNGSIWDKYYIFDISGDLAVRGDAYKPGGGSWSSISDIRMKTDVNLADNNYLLNMIDNFPLYKYKWNDEYLTEYKNQYSGYQYGTIAQELVELSNKYPELKGTFKIIEAQINNKKYDDFHTVNSSQFTYILIGVVKELINNNRSLLNKNNELQNEIISIKNDINKLFEILDK